MHAGCTHGRGQFQGETGERYNSRAGRNSPMHLWPLALTWKAGQRCTLRDQLTQAERQHVGFCGLKTTKVCALYLWHS